ncbi:MAG: Rrf2 family transcriptional regulator, partial [Vallitaleaceae bacterium]|nr:Rrf2 family transcriptional regulator [Vallitaleaceae bacterium]
MKISTKGRYALEAVVDLAVYSNNGLESLKNIADRLDISKNYLEQLFVSLRQKGIVDSVRGAQGGYKLSKPAAELTAGDVVRAVEGPLSPVACLDDDNCNQPCGSADLCVTRILWHKLMIEINEAVDAVTIDDLVQS